MAQQRVQRSKSNRGDDDRAAQWQRRLLAWSASGLTRSAFCAREGLNLSTFDYWRRRQLAGASEAKGAAKGQASRARLPVPVLHAQSVATARKRPALTLLPLTLEVPPEFAVLRLNSPQGWCLEVPAGVAPAWLAELLRHLP